MNPKIISVPSQTSKLPKYNSGKVLFERLNTLDQNAVAFHEIQTGKTCTYGEFTSKMTSLATSLRKTLKIKKHDHLCIISENSYEFWLAAIAAFSLATPVHLLNPGYTIFELKKFVVMSKPVLIFCSETVLTKVKELKKEFSFIKFIVVFDNIDDGDILLFDNLTQEKVGTFEFEEVTKTEEEVAYIANSSGTTGLPKGVMISHENLRLNFSHAEDKEIYLFDQKSVVLHIIPFYHVHGCSISYCGLYLGVKFLIMNQFVPDIYLETIQNYKVNKLFIVPTLADFFVNSPLLDKYNLSSIDEIFSAAGLLKETTYKKLLKKFNLKTIRQIYGLTEVGAAVFISPVSSSKPGSTGKVSRGTTVKIVDTSGEILGCNQSGEICVKSVAMIGYINDPESTRAAFDADGFIKSGDVGYYDEDQYFYIVDRIKDLIKYKSFQVPPLEIEEILMQHPGVKDVAVVGKPDDRYGELAVAFVVKNDVEVTEDEIVDFVARFVCLEKRLHGGVRFVEEIPKNTVGKILRKDLRKLL